MSTVRLNKYLAQRVHCSRRQADDLIEEGRVLVNDEVAVLGARVDPDVDKVEVNGKSVGERRPAVYLIYHKPVGVICTTDVSMPDNVIARIGHKERIFYVGRLDVESSGLLLLTNDGRIVNSLLRGSASQEKEYRVEVDRPYDSAFVEAMVKGVDIGDPTPTKPSRMKPLSDDSFHVILTEGRNRQVRRMCSSLGYEVRRLTRLRFGPLTLDGLPEDQWRALTPPEVQRLLQEAGYVRTPAPLHGSQRSAPPPAPTSPRDPWERKAPRGRNEDDRRSRNRDSAPSRDPWASRRYQGREDNRHRDGWREPDLRRRSAAPSRERSDERPRRPQERQNRYYDDRPSGPSSNRSSSSRQDSPYSRPRHEPSRSDAPRGPRREPRERDRDRDRDNRSTSRPSGPSFEGGRHRRGATKDEAIRASRPRSSSGRERGERGERIRRTSPYSAPKAQDPKPSYGPRPGNNDPRPPTSRPAAPKTEAPRSTAPRAEQPSPRPSSENPWARARIRSNYGKTKESASPGEPESETKES